MKRILTKIYTMLFKFKIGKIFFVKIANNNQLPLLVLFFFHYNTMSSNVTFLMQNYCHLAKKIFFLPRSKKKNYKFFFVVWQKINWHLVVVNDFVTMLTYTVHSHKILWKNFQKKMSSKDVDWWILIWLFMVKILFFF